MSVSTFTWLDHDAEQARRAAELVRALSEPDTVDSIGIGAIRDGFAGIFFPGTSTIQTRARYFVLVPWAMKAVAARRPRDRAQYNRFLNDIETATIEALVKGNPSETRGIIGSQKGAATKRKASSVYWNALAEWRIRVAHDMTMSSYRSSVLSAKVGERIDGEAGDAAVFQVWDEIPPPPPSFPSDVLGILPSTFEAEYLLARMAGTFAGGLGIPAEGKRSPSLLAATATGTHLADADELWHIPIASVPPDLHDAVRHAEAFSLLIQGARLRYVQLLFEAQRAARFGASTGEEDLTQRTDDWIDDVERSSDSLASWLPNLPSMYDLLGRFGVSIGGFTREFVCTWCTAAVTDPSGAMAARATADLIRNREITLKSPNARLASESALRAWDGSLYGATRLDYRWSIAQRMIHDCRTSLKGNHAGT